MGTYHISNIKKAAKEIFSQKGYKEAKIAEIAKEAGVAVGTIYTNFKGKKELFESLNIPELENYRPEYSKKRNEILQIALSIFRLNGYSATSMEQIASECGFTKAVLYQYFSSKEELFSAIFQDPGIMNDLDHLVIEYANENLEEVLVKIGKKFMELFEDEGRLNLIRIVIAECARFPQLGEIMYDRGINKVAEMFSNYLKILTEKGIIECPDPKLTARSYFGMLYSFIITGKIINPSDNEFDINQVTNYAAKLFSNSLVI